MKRKNGPAEHFELTASQFEALYTLLLPYDVHCYIALEELPDPISPVIEDVQEVVISTYINASLDISGVFFVDIFYVGIVHRSDCPACVSNLRFY